MKTSLNHNVNSKKQEYRVWIMKVLHFILSYEVPVISSPQILSEIGWIKTITLLRISVWDQKAFENLVSQQSNWFSIQWTSMCVRCRTRSPLCCLQLSRLVAGSADNQKDLLKSIRSSCPLISPHCSHPWSWHSPRSRSCRVRQQLQNGWTPASIFYCLALSGNGDHSRYF